MIPKRNPDPSCIFSADFRDGYDAVTKNPYVNPVTIGGIVRNNGYVTFTNAMLKLGKSVLSNSYSIRFKIRFNSFPSPTGVYNFIGTKGGYGYFRLNELGFLNSNAVLGDNISYTNGISTTGISFELNKWTEAVIGGSVLTYLNYKEFITTLFGYINTPISCSFDLEFVKIYNRILSAPEIKNLYEGKTFVPFEDSSEVLNIARFNNKTIDRYKSILVSTAIVLEQNKIFLKQSTSSLSIGNLVINNGTTDNPFTLSFWIPDNYYPNIVTKTFLLYNTSDFGVQVSDSGRVRAFFRDPITSGYISRYTNQNEIRGRKNKHITITYSGSRLHTGIKIYTNGVQSVVGTDSNGAFNNVAVGNFPLVFSTSSGNFNYSLNKVRLFMKELNAYQVSQIYTSERKILNL